MQKTWMRMFVSVCTCHLVNAVPQALSVRANVVEELQHLAVHARTWRQILQPGHGYSWATQKLLQALFAVDAWR